MTVTSRRALAALATATVLGATALTVPAFAADAPGKAGEAPKTVLKEGTLEWGVKESFRKYLTLPFVHGETKVADGAKQAEKNGVFTFTGGEGKQDSASQSISAAFKGSVHFLGHPKRGSAGFDLDITLADVHVTADAKSGGKKGSITADVTTGDGKKQDDVRIAALDLSGVKPVDGADGVKTYAKIPVKLTAEGSKVFTYEGNPFYKEGEDLDPATLSVKESAEEPSKKDEGTQTDDGSASDKGTQTDGGTQTSGGSQTDGGKQTSGGSTADKGSKADEGSKAENAAGTDIADGNLDWGVKKSFLEYLAKPMAGGKAEAGDGARKSGNNFRFVKGQGKYDAAAGTLTAAFTGSVHFTAHKGELDLKFSGLKVEASSKGGTLSADVTSKDLAGKTSSSRIDLAKLQLTADALKAKGGVVLLSKVPASLTDEGAKAFSYKDKQGNSTTYYTPGTALDPVTVAVAFDKDAKLPDDTSGTGTGGTGTTGSTGTGTGGTATTTGTANTTGATTGDTTSLASTGASTPTAPLLGAAGALVLAGSGAVFATRRRGRGGAQG
ncbi:HtaA domain-containing protein [Streptomyces roseoverticillatus]|uniref:HtaA domain-containing protein n=1 Tax=Streptomyces roseoverticillatus TaxID=66429 RepID=UPI0004BEB2ED|nr:HtaA domain-containing protein [Streptomyces roseoverticillatus]